MKARWLLALLLVVVLSGAIAPAKAEALHPMEGGIQLLEVHPDGLVLDLTAPIAALDQSLAAARPQKVQESTTQESDLLGGAAFLASPASDGSAFPLYSVLVGLPPGGEVELNVIAAERMAVGQPRLSAVSALNSASASPAPVRLSGEAWIRDRRVARLEFAPLQLQSGGANWYNRMRVELRFSALPARDERPAAALGDDREILAQLINPGQARDWRVSPAASGAIRDPFADAPATPLGPRYKLSVTQDGFYRLAQADLLAANPAQVTFDPRNLHLYCQGQPVALYVQGEADGSFDSGDYLLFYGQKFRGDRLVSRHPEESSYYTAFDNGWQPQYSATQVEKYTDENVYWLVVESTPGLRVAPTPSVPGSAPLVSSYRETRRAEQSLIWWSFHYTGEDTWFWDRLQDTKDHSYAIILTDPDPAGGPIQVYGEMVARNQNINANPDHHTRVLFNDQVVENTTWDGLTRHTFNQSLPQSVLINGTNTLKVTVFWDAYTGQFSDYIDFDWYTVSYDRLLVAESDALTFGVSPTVAQRYRASGFTSPAVEVWNITQPFQPVRLTGASLAGGTLEFESSLTGSQRYAAAGSSAWKTPARVEFYNPPDLLSSSLGADYIIITHPNFLTSAQRLADYRAAQGMRVKVINFFDLVNQFDDGIYNPIAIKNFLAYTFLHWQAPAPAYVVLVGDGHWNFKGYNPASYGTAPIYLPPNLAWIDAAGITQQVNQGENESANLLVNVVGTDPLPDLGVGRMPVNNDSELNAIIDKIIAYEAGPKNQPWQYRALFLADNPDPNSGAFDQFSDALIQDYISHPYQASKAYLYLTGDANTDKTRVADQTAATINGLNAGALVVSYIGHGVVNGWSSSRFFTTTQIPSLANGNNLPVVLSMTCVDGAWYHPYPNSAGFPSGFAEGMLRASSKGAIATFSPTGWGYTYGHDILERGFLTALYQQHSTRLSALTSAARLSVYTSGSELEMIHQFTLFGDPALKLKLPDLQLYLPMVRR